MCEEGGGANFLTPRCCSTFSFTFSMTNDHLEDCRQQRMMSKENQCYLWPYWKVPSGRGGLVWWNMQCSIHGCLIQKPGSSQSQLETSYVSLLLFLIDCPRLSERLSLVCNKFYVTLLMCLWCIRMLSIYWTSQGNPGGVDSFVRGQYYMTFERSGSSHINFQKSSVYEPKSIVNFPLQFPKLHYSFF